MKETLLTRADVGVGEGLFDSVAWVMEKIEMVDDGRFQSAVMHAVNEDSPQRVEFYLKPQPLVTDKPECVWAECRLA